MMLTTRTPDNQTLKNNSQEVLMHTYTKWNGKKRKKHKIKPTGCSYKEYTELLMLNYSLHRNDFSQSEQFL